MSTDATGLDPRAAEALLAFWAEAGVDVCVDDLAVDRLAQGETRPAPARAGARAKPAAAAPTDPDGGLAEARTTAAGAADLAALEAAIGAYQGCALRSMGARRAVFARGDPSAPVMIVGEAPGAEEDAQGLPFVGRAGKLLDRMLAAAGLEPRVFITNTVFWRPPGNRNPTAQEQAACLPFLERAIELAAPKILVLSGGVAAKSLLKREEGILSLRGRWLDWTSEDGSMTIPALPTLHPAFLLRQPAAKKKAWDDMLMLVSRLEALG